MQLACPSCQVGNRVPDDRLGDGPRCGRCRTPLLPHEPVGLQGDALQRYLQASGQPGLVDCWAEWCGPCKAMAPDFAALAARRGDVRFVKLDTESDPATAARLGIRSIPTLVLFRGGREQARISGAMPAARLGAWLDQALAAGTPAASGGH